MPRDLPTAPSGRRFFTRFKRPSTAVIEAVESRLLLSASSLVYQGADGRLVYTAQSDGDRVPDFSSVGYKTGNVTIPDTAGALQVPIKVTLNPGAAGVDRTTDIQNAINSVSAMSLDANGFRGAVLLKAGNYPISGQLSITASGVVIEGEGNNKATGTALEATGTSTRQLFEVHGSGSRSTVSGTTYSITDSYVPVGASSFHVSGTSNLHVGDTIIVNRPSPANWIHDIGMDRIPNPDGGTSQWTAGSKDQNWDRVITSVDTVNNIVTIDIPLTNSLDAKYGGGSIHRYTWSGRISQVGIENMYIYSDSASSVDLLHATGSMTWDSIQNGWVNNITSDGFATNQIVFDSGSKWLTISNSVIENTSQGTQAPPAGVSFNGQCLLGENLTFHGAYHALALGASVPGPNVMVNATADGKGAGSGPHQRWATGGLMDNFYVTGTQIQVVNAGDSGSGHGWEGANFVLWNCGTTAQKCQEIDVQNPPTAQNWVFGGSASTTTGDGIFDQYNSTIQPQSLYLAQLWDRMHADPTIATTAFANPTLLTGTTTNLSILGASDAGEANLTYAWTTILKPSGASNPTFSANGTNAARNTTATLSQIGTYAFLCTITDPGGLKTTSTVVVSNQSITTVSGDPDPANDTMRIVRNGSFIDVYKNGGASPILHQDYATSPVLVLSSGGGIDSITVDYTGGNPVPADGLIVDAGAGSDVVSVLTTSGNDTVSLAANSITVNGGAFTYASAEEVDLSLGAGSDTITAGGDSSVSAQTFGLNISGGGTVSINSGSTLPSFTDLDVTGATLSLNGTSQSIDSLNGSGTINNGAASATLTVGDQSGNGAFSGTLANGSAGSLSLTKNGFGALVLGGSNSFTGPTTINAGEIQTGNAASLVNLTGPIQFGGGTLHITSSMVSPNLSNKYTTTFSGATGSNTGTFNIDTGVVFTIGTLNGSACWRTGGGASAGGSFIKIGGGTLQVLSSNGQQDDPLLLKQGTILIQNANALGGGDSGVELDMTADTTLICQLDGATNSILTPIKVDGLSFNIVLDRITPGAAGTYSINKLSNGYDSTLNLSAGSNVTSGIANLTIGSISFGGNGTFNVTANCSLTVTGTVSSGSTSPQVFGLTKTGAGLMLLNGANTYNGATTVSAGTLQCNGSISASPGVTVASNASFIAGSTQSLSSLTINNGGSASITTGGNKLLTVSSLSINGTGKLDVTTNGLAVLYAATSPLTSIKGWVIGGWNNGAWNGAGINSSSAAAISGPHRPALGYAEAGSVLSGNVFMGQTITLPAVLVRYVLPGDANLDGTVNTSDFTALAQSFGGSNRIWSQGDFSYNGLINALDFNALATNFGQPIPAPLPDAALLDAPSLFGNTMIDPFDQTVLGDSNCRVSRIPSKTRAGASVARVSNPCPPVSRRFDRRSKSTIA